MLTASERTCTLAVTPISLPESDKLSWYDGKEVVESQHLIDRRAPEPTVLQACYHNTLICGNFHRNPNPGTFGHDQAVGAGLTVARRSLMVYCACAEPDVPLQHLR